MDLEDLDWPVQHAQLGQLEQALCCKICHDIFTGPMVLPCGHTYCSQCIRGTFDFKIREGHKVACPECRVVLDPADLRISLALRDACTLFRQCKPLLVRAVHLSVQQAAAGPQQQAWQLQQGRQQQQPAQRAMRQHSNAQQQHQQQQDHAAGDAAAEAGPSSSRPHSAPMGMRRTRSSTRTGSRANSTPAAYRTGSRDAGANCAMDEPWTDSQDTDGEGSDADSLEAQSPLPASKRRRTGDVSTGKENMAAARRAAQAPAAKAQQLWPSSSSSSEAVDAVAPASNRPAKQIRADHAECPICGMTVGLKFIELHVNECLAKQQADDDFAAPRGGRASASTQQRAPAVHNSRRAATHAKAARSAPVPCPLPPKLCFSMMKPKEARDRVTALGLVVEPKASKEALEATYQAYRTFVQSLRDGGRCLTQEQAVAEFGAVQRQRQRAARQQQLVAPAHAAATGPSSFSELIKQTRARQQGQQVQQQLPHGHQQQASPVHHAAEDAMLLEQQAQQQPAAVKPYADLSSTGPQQHGQAMAGELSDDDQGEEGLSQPQNKHVSVAGAAATAGAAASGATVRLGRWPSYGVQACGRQQAALGVQQQQCQQLGQPIIIEDSDVED